MNQDLLDFTAWVVILVIGFVLVMLLFVAIDWLRRTRMRRRGKHF